MRRLLIAAIVAIAVPCVLFGQAATQKGAPAKSQSAQQEVAALERAWLDAGLKSDAAWFERHLADTYINTNEEGVQLNKAATLADVKAGTTKYESLSYDALTTEGYGDTVIARGIVVVKGTSKGKDASGRFAWTDTWVKRGGEWQCVAGHASAIRGK